MRPLITSFQKLPPLRAAASAKLFVFGATIGPIVDSFHNQCLLRYQLAPITIEWPESLSRLAALLEQDYLLCSSWSVPLLLGFAYVVLGDLLPRLFQSLLPQQETSSQTQTSSDNLRAKAIWAVLSTAAVIKLSQYLELHQPFGVDGSAQANYISLLAATLLQWWYLDGTLPALLAAGITSIGGPLSELPFVANGFWEYLPQAADYLPLANVNVAAANGGSILPKLLGPNYQELALSSITGPCYFAVTLDAIALGRWFQSTTNRKDDNELTN